MVRGRRTRAAAQISTEIKSDELFASPKRKDCKLDTMKIKQKNYSYRPDSMNSSIRARPKAVPITNYFQVKQNSTSEIIYVSEIDENACDSFDNTHTNNESNIFLQTPVLHLNIDKSPNQPSSIVINKTIPNTANFSALTNAALVPFTNIVIGDSIQNLTTSHQTHQPHLQNIEFETSGSSDCSSWDSGVVADKILELSPSKRHKPPTPHRIVCHSPVKHASSETTPASALSNLNIGSKTNPTCKRRLNIQQTENLTVTTIAPNKKAVKKPIPQASNKSTILNSLTDPSAQQNCNNNKNTKLTDYFPVRRSVRKTKQIVEQEQIRNIEAAICSGQETGLKISKFLSKGRGIIASKPFMKGEFVVEYIGDLINMSEAKTREHLYATDENTGCYMYYFKFRNQQYCIDATAESGKLGRLVNHSRNGNLITKAIFYRNRPHLVLIAKENIEEGDELTYDYGDRSKESLLHHPWLAL